MTSKHRQHKVPPDRPEPGSDGPEQPPLPHGFEVIPAVDLLGDEAVRLERGAFDRVTIRAGSPDSLVRRFAAERPSLIHVVDLEGARDGRVRPDVIARLAEVAGDVPLQASGGIRSVEDAGSLLDAGAVRVIVGTAAFATEDALDRFVDALGEQLVVAVDARDGMLMVGGWEAGGAVPIAEAAARCARAGAARLHCTAIDRDGTMGGPDIALLREVRDASGLPIVAAGGIRSLDDLRLLASERLEGAVVGRALLEGGVPLDAIRAG
jgi:phosphoribosylformimino-5-aminoimidazole carboxamide ribotide isomerase